MSTTQGETKAFISASFDNSAQEPIEFFIGIAKALGINTIWLKEKYETRPVEDKIKDNLKKCNAFIQIHTEDVERESKEKGWLGNEVGWADSFEIRIFALFVEKGARASGAIVTKTEPLSFDRNALVVIVPKVIGYLRDLKQRTSESIPESLQECLRAIEPR
ncbi:MAG: hypothetical protein KAV25_04865 [Methanophagales archaeon]|nr:hypothetical protein [Methanophagales archaeon]